MNEGPKIMTTDEVIDALLQKQAKVCAEVTKSLTVNGEKAINKLISKKTKSKEILR